MSSLQDGFKGFYNEFKDWNKKELLQRLYDICIDGINKQAEINKKEEEIDRLNNIINELEYGIQKIRDLFYEKFRIHYDGEHYSINNAGLQDFYDILDKLKELKEGK